MTDVQIPSYQEGLVELRTNLKGMLPADALQVFDQDAVALEHMHTDILKLKAGDHAPDFTLSNAKGEHISLAKMLESDRVVLTFYRGTWCPYCNLQLAQYQQVLSEIQAENAVLVAISSQTPDASLNIQEKNNLDFEVLSDVGNEVTRKFTTVFKNGDAPLQTMTNLGFDFDSFYGDDSREIPVPATFIIEKNGTISFAKAIGGDYRNRVEAAEILQALHK